MAKKSRFWAIVALLWTMLMPSLVQAAPQKAAEKKEGLFSGLPFVGGLFSTILNWMEPKITPDWDMWWLLAFTFPLTILWMAWASNGTRNFFNKVGGTVAGLPALFLMLSFWGTFLGIALMIFGKVTGFLALAANPSLKGAWDMFLGILKLIPIAIAIWLLKKIPGLEGLVREILGKVSEYARKIWGYRETIYQNPHWFWQALGGLLLALLINSKLATRLSEQYVGIPGVIPGISGAVGLFFLFFRTVGGRKLVGKLAAKPLPNGDWPCLKCNHFNVAANEACGKCGAKNPFRPRKCQGCPKGYAEDIPWDVKRCPKCGKELGASAAKAKATPKSSPSTAVAAAPTGTAAQPTTLPCPHCGRDIDKPETARCCPHCGQRSKEVPWAKEALERPLSR